MLEHNSSLSPVFTLPPHTCERGTRDDMPDPGPGDYPKGQWGWTLGFWGRGYRVILPASTTSQSSPSRPSTLGLRNACTPFSLSAARLSACRFPQPWGQCTNLRTCTNRAIAADETKMIPLSLHTNSRHSKTHTHENESFMKTR
jgi:hypothetical protein